MEYCHGSGDIFLVGGQKKVKEPNHKKPVAGDNEDNDYDRTKSLSVEATAQQRHTKKNPRQHLLKKNHIFTPILSLLIHTK